MSKTLKKMLGLILVLILVSSCEKDSKKGNSYERDFIVAFQEQSILYGEISDSKLLSLVFSEVAEEAGSVEVDIKSFNSTYGVDFKTIPDAINSVLTIPFNKGDKVAKFDFVNLIYPFDRSDKTVEFRIKAVNYNVKKPVIQGYDIMVVSFDTAIGGVLEPPIGGPSQPMQVYVDLGGKAMYPIQRDSWDLSFYNGKDFRVRLNGSIYMAAGSLSSTDLDKTTESDFKKLKDVVQIGTFDPENVKYIDFPNGALQETAIREISLNDIENKIYLLNLGFTPGKGNVQPGAVEITGAERGWRKIRILRKGDDYVLQYADLNATTHKEIVIQKSNGFNFNYFSFNTETLVNVEPSEKKWDLNFTVFTNTVDQNGDPKGSYGFSDFIINNRYSGVSAYKVMIPDGDKNFYKKFDLSNVDPELLSLDLRTIGGSWRDVANNKILFRNVFYVIKDSKGNLYKMRVLSFMNAAGERGYPKFEYSLLR